MNTKKISFIFTFLFIVYNGFSQDSKSYYQIASDYRKKGDYKNAVIYYEKSLPTDKTTYGINHIFTGDTYFFIGVCYSRVGKYDKAISNLKSALEIYESSKIQSYKSSSETKEDAKKFALYTLCEIGKAYFDSSDYDNALKFFQNELSMRKTVSGENHAETARCYQDIGLVYEYKGEYKTALSYYQKQLDISKNIYGEIHLKTADAYRNIACIDFYLGNYSDSQKYFLKTAEIREKILGTNSPEYAQSLQDITSLWINTGWYDDALETNKQAEKIFFNLNTNPISFSFAILYHERGRIFYRKGDYKQASIYWNKTLEINQKLHGDKNVYTAKTYSNLGHNYQMMGDYSRAIASIESALKSYKSIFGNSHPDIALCYRTLGVIYRCKDDFDTALSYFNQALEMYKKFLGEKHDEVARCYLDIGSIYENKKDFHKALDYYLKASNMLYDIFGYETADIASCYDRIARIYDIIGEHEDALSLYNAAINIYIKLCGEESSYTSIEYTMLGWHYAGLNDVENTIASFRKSYSGFEKSTNYNQIITDLSLILKDAQTYHYDNDVSFIRDTITLATDTVERAQLDMSSIKSDLLQKSLSIYYYGVDIEAKNNNPAKAFEYSEMLRSRSFLDQIGLEQAVSLDGVTNSERKQIKNLTSQITSARKEIEKQSNLPIPERNTKKLTEAEKSLSSAEKSLSTLDDKIGKRIPSYAQLRTPQTVRAKDAQKWCGKNQIILEYVLWNPEILDSCEKLKDPDIHKCAEEINFASYCLVVTNKKITAVPLDSSYNYSSAINSLRDAITHRPIKSEVTFEKQRNELYEKLVQPILPYIKGVKNVLIVPNDNLSFLPFDMLRENSDSDDFGKKYAISISPSVSISMIADKVESKSSDALLFGGAWYDSTLSEEEHNQTLRGNGKREYDRSFAIVDNQTKLSIKDLQNILRNEGSAQYFEQKKLNWHDLPGTVVELEMLQKTTFPKAHIETQKSASESTLKKMSKDGLLSNYSILHFACHGYFDSDFSEMSSVLFSEVSGKLTESEDDGYLTIGEAASLNLNAQMVCLSACQTGLGEVKKGEGMIGLSRAFMVAGSKIVGVTIWSVDDAATAEFMTRMYKKVKSGMSYSEAYRKVKNEFRNSDEYHHPYYWAGFVVYE